MCPRSHFQAKYSSVDFLFVNMCFIFLIVVMSACGNTTSLPSAVGTAKQSVPTPADLFAPHVLTVGTYINYLPQEFIDSKTSQFMGFDVDVMNALAQRMNLKASFVNANFSNLLDSLVTRHFDIVISAVVITADLQKKVAFIPYLKSGEALLASRGNSLHINGINDLCGFMVAIKGNSVEYNELMAASSNCQQQGHLPISLAVKENYPDLIQLLNTKSVDCVYLDLSQAGYYMKLNPGRFEIVGPIINPGTEGIAIRLDDPSMLHSFQIAFNQLKSSGLYQTLVQRWGLTRSELSSG